MSDQKPDSRLVTMHDVSPGVATIRIERPKRGNAFDLETWRALEQCVVELEEDDSRRVGILCGAGGVFSAGGDIRAPIAMGTGVGRPAGRLRYSQRVLQRVRALDKPVIAAVECYALGMGFSVALACDFVVAGESSFFAAPHSLRGLVPDGGIVWSLVRALGRSEAARLALFGERLTAQEAKDAGLVLEVVPDGRAEASAVALAERLLAGPADVIALTRRLVHAAENGSFEEFLREEWIAVALNMYGADAAEGLRAFVERRAPDFGDRPAG